MLNIKKKQNLTPANYTFDPIKHNQNIARRLTERSEFFDTDTRALRFGNIDNGVRQEYCDDTASNGSLGAGVGEITGQRFSRGQLEQGMPMRSHIRDDSKTRYNDYENMDEPYNPALDIDLYAEKPKLNIKYFDPTNQVEEPGFSDLNNKTMLLPSKQDVNPISRLAMVSNMFTFNFLTNFLDNMKGRKSLVLSPFSMLNLFIVLYRGSKGSTEQELKNYFYLADKNSSIQALNHINNQLVKNGTMRRMNLICVSKQFNINHAFVNYTNHIASTIQIDTNRGESEALRLNHIIKNTTNGMITNLINPAMINGQTAMILINTLYFYSQWKKTFNRRLTQNGVFYGVQQKYVPYMKSSDENCRYYEDNEFQVLEKDYTDESFCMGFVLPKNQHDQPLISHEQFEFYMTQLRKEKITTLIIPKFRHESKYRVDNLFKKYGLREIFSNPDFSDITPGQSPYVGAIMHIAIIDVNETGTEAAAATAMMMMNDAMSQQPKTINFIANHPFLYYIRHIPSNTVLFIGQYY